MANYRKEESQTCYSGGGADMFAARLGFIWGRVEVEGLFSITDRLLERALDGVSARQRVTAHNIANANTPGYKRYTLSFEAELKQALEGSRPTRLRGTITHPRHIPIGEPRTRVDGPFTVRRDTTTTMRNDGNNVDIEAEMAQIIKDQVFYQALADLVSRRYAMLRDAITEGRR